MDALSETLASAQKQILDIRAAFEKKDLEYDLSRNETVKLAEKYERSLQERQTLRETNRVLQSDILDLRAQLQDLETRLELSALKSSDLEGQPGFTARSTGAENSSNYKEECNRLYIENQRLRDDINRMNANFHNMEQRHGKTEQERQRYEDTVSSLRHELTGVRRELVEHKMLSETREKEFSFAQVYLAKADALSVSEIVDKVNAFNDKVSQAALSISNSFTLQDYTLPQAEARSYHVAAGKILGAPIARILTQKPSAPNINPFLVHIVFQVLISQFCCSKIELWRQCSPETNDVLSCLYGAIKSKEKQAISGRWRAFTHAYVRPSSAVWISEFLSTLENIKKISGWTFVDPTKQDAFIQKLGPIFKATRDIQITLAEQFTSADIEAFVANANQKFSPQGMEDAWGESGANPPSGQKLDVVVGTTGIGLKRQAPQPPLQEPEGCALTSPSLTVPLPNYDIILAPKIILQSTLQEKLYPSARKPTSGEKAPGVPRDGEQDGRGEA